MYKMVNFRSVIILLFICTSTVAADENLIEEIVVTAQKREQNLQDVPISISVFSEGFFDKTGIDNVSALIDYTPGFTGTTTGVTNPGWGIRGAVTNDATAGSENSVGVFQDEAYIGRDQLAAASFFDVERVEALKGPQGSLFGRNTLAGAVNIITKKPGSEDTLDLLIGVGNEGQAKYSAIGNLAVSDTFALRAGVQYREFSGIDVNIINGRERSSEDLIGRIMARWNPSDSVEILAMVQGSKNENNLQRYHVPELATDFGEPAGTEDFDKEIAQAGPNFEEIDTTGVNLRVTWNINETMQLTSISDFRDFEHEYGQDIDGLSSEDLLAIVFGDSSLNGIGGVNFRFDPFADTLAQEFRLSGSRDRADWMVGVSYFKEDISESNFIYVDVPESSVPPDQQDSIGVTKSIAAYADMTFRATDQLSLTAGVRANSDEKSWTTNNIARLFGFLGDTGGQILSAKDDWSDVSGRLVIDYAVSDSVLVYGSWAQGFKAGGFNATAEDTNGDGVGDTAKSFDPEDLTAYEIGAKMSLLDGALVANVSAYTNDYTNLQVETLENLQLLVANAAKADVKGLEVELTWVPSIEDLVLRATYAKIDGEYEGVIGGIDVTGNKVHFTPENSFTFSAEYEVDLNSGSLDFFGGYIWIDEQFFDPFNSSLLKEDAYSLINANIRYTAESQKWFLALTGSNLGDTEYALLNQDPVGFGVRHYNRALPRMYMLQLGMYF